MKLLIKTINNLVTNKMINFIIFCLILISVDTIAQNETINCAEARKKYLELNPDVAKAGMDAWAHYTYYGKKEGRIWPSCNNSNSESTLKDATINQNNVIQSTCVSDVASSEFEYLVTLGKSWSKPISQYDTIGINNQFDFTEKPLPVLSENFVNPATDLNVKDKLKKFDNFLKGGDSLVVLLAKKKIELATYPHDLLIKYNYRLNEYFSSFERNYRIIVSSEKNVFDKVKEFGYVTTDRGFTALFISPDKKSKKLERKLVKILSKQKAISLDKNNLKEYLMKMYGFNEAYIAQYQELKDCIASLDNLMTYFSKYFIKLNSSDSYKSLMYIGPSVNNIPNGFGILVSDKKKLLMSGYWEEGFPVLLYSVNNYHYIENGDEKGSYKYLALTSANNKYKRRMIKLYEQIYSKSNVSCFDIYIGECDNKDGRYGYGSYFSEKNIKEKVSYYTGYWGSNGEKNGNGKLYSDNYEYSGEWRNGELPSGKLTWPDKHIVYTGQFSSDLNMNGMGKKTYSNGLIQEGLFENGSFMKSLAQIEQEKIQQEQEQAKREVLLALEKTLSELKKAADNEKRMDKALFITDMNEVLDNPNYYFGKVIQIVARSGNIDQQDRNTVVPDGYVKNQMFKNTPYYRNDLKITEGDLINWKHVTEVNSDITITINIPNRFFENDLIPKPRGSMNYYTLWLDVYPMRESRSSSVNGHYNSGGSSKDVNFELLHIQRYKQ
jgi:hypothetical protein